MGTSTYGPHTPVPATPPFPCLHTPLSACTHASAAHKRHKERCSPPTGSLQVWRSPPVIRSARVSFGGGGWHDACVNCCLKRAAPVGLSPLPLVLSWNVGKK